MSDYQTRRSDEPSLPRVDAVQEFPRRETRPPRRPPVESVPSDHMMTQAVSAVQRTAIGSVGEIEKLITELEGLRDFLRQEGVRIQREIDGYARLSDEATKSTRIIYESVVQWKTAPPRGG